MASLKSILSLVDDRLSDVFERRGYDAAKDRAAMIKRIDATRDKFLATEPPRGRKDFAVSNNVVRYQPTLHGQPVALDGRTELHVPAERFADFLNGLKAAVEAGELDNALEAASKGDAPAGAKPARTPRAKREPGQGGGREWTPERRERFAASIAARKAAKAKGASAA